MELLRQLFKKNENNKTWNCYKWKCNAEQLAVPDMSNVN